MKNHELSPAAYLMAALREDLGLSQYELAAKIDRTRNFLSLVEAGRCRIPLDLAPAIASALQYDPKVFAGMVLYERHPEVAQLLLPTATP